jgi:hypothetical protein
MNIYTLTTQKLFIVILLIFAFGRGGGGGPIKRCYGSMPFYRPLSRFNILKREYVEMAAVMLQ